MRTFVYPYKQASQSAKALAGAINCKRIKRTNSRYRPRPSDLIINWGSSSIPAYDSAPEILNTPELVSLCANKLDFFTFISEKTRVSVPMWTSCKDTATQWARGGGVVMCRTSLTGHSGRGIVVMDLNYEERNGTPDAPLYTLYVKKKEEYRVHVAFGEVIHVQRKARCRDVPDELVNWTVRNREGGFIYQINDVVAPDFVTSQATKAVEVVGLDFGAVDVIWNQHEDRAYVLEINTAPGLMGTTLDKYKEAFNEYINKLEN